MVIIFSLWLYFINTPLLSLLGLKYPMNRESDQYIKFYKNTGSPGTIHEVTILYRQKMSD